MKSGAAATRVYYPLSTPLGTMAVEAEGGNPTAVLFPGSWSQRGTAASEPPPRVRAVLAELDAYFRGGEQDTRLAEDLVLSTIPPGFNRRVLLAVISIPRGRTVTYGDIAASAGHPGAARAAGNALRRNPFPVLVPCHRVIRSDGDTGGYAAGRVYKKLLLDLEKEGGGKCTAGGSRLRADPPREILV
jgi:methylated-DNA-[protein]-cysteine S-methyltransferase